MLPIWHIARARAPRTTKKRGRNPAFLNSALNSRRLRAGGLVVVVIDQEVDPGAHQDDCDDQQKG